MEPCPGKIKEYEPLAKGGFSFKIRACRKFHRKHGVDFPRIKF